MLSVVSISSRPDRLTIKGARHMDLITEFAASLRRVAKLLGPYLMLELLLPGGTLVALTLFLVRRWSLRLDIVARFRSMWRPCQASVTSGVVSPNRCRFCAPPID
jgi:hypothetical protein